MLPTPELQVHGERSAAEMRESFEAERRRESSRFTDADLQRMVDRLFIEADPDRANFHGLLYAGRRPVPFLIKALNEPRTQTTVFFREGYHLNRNSPFERICDLLGAQAPAEAARPLARYLEHPDPAFRRQAGWVLAQIGTPECLEPVKKALADADRQVREHAMIGLGNGLEEGRRNETFLRGVFAALVPLLKDGVYSTSGPAEILVGIDSAKAVPMLQSPRYFSLSNPQLHQVITALNHGGVKVPHRILLPLLGEMERLAKSEKTRELDYEAALILYAHNPDESAENRFQALLGAPSSTVAAAAGTGLEILANINPDEAVSWAYEQHGFAAMTKPQQYYHAIQDYRDEVNNGGHHQYFYNSSGDVYETAIAGLRTIGATSKIGILSNAMLAFAPMRPETNNEIRRLQMEPFGSVQDSILAAADKSFYDSERRSGESLAVLLARYALKHRSDFAPVSGFSEHEFRRTNVKSR